MQLHTLKSKTARPKTKTIGRGGKRGKTSGRGTKGQRARAGHKMRPELRDIIKKLPKNRGYRFLSVAPKVAEVSIGSLEKLAAKTEVTPTVLVEQGLVKRVGGMIPAIKILADGTLTKALVVSGCRISAAARAKLEAAGGSIKV
jgi:large subunit ribosomal protein L15